MHVNATDTHRMPHLNINHVGKHGNPPSNFLNKSTIPASDTFRSMIIIRFCIGSMVSIYKRSFRYQKRFQLCGCASQRQFRGKKYQLNSCSEIISECIKLRRQNYQREYPFEIYIARYHSDSMKFLPNFQLFQIFDVFFCPKMRCSIRACFISHENM